MHLQLHNPELSGLLPILLNAPPAEAPRAGGRPGRDVPESTRPEDQTEIPSRLPFLNPGNTSQCRAHRLNPAGLVKGLTLSSFLFQNLVLRPLNVIYSTYPGCRLAGLPAPDRLPRAGGPQAIPTAATCGGTRRKPQKAPRPVSSPALGRCAKSRLQGAGACTPCWSELFYLDVNLSGRPAAEGGAL